ncbi:MAG: recombinase family protein [Hyphomicrobiaceae bacterium]
MAGKSAKRATSKAEPTKAFAYLRTSTATNVGEGKDSDQRQREEIIRFAAASGFEVVEWFYDVGSGELDIAHRPEFRRLLDLIAGNGVRAVIVEDASRFARKLMVQEVGITLLSGLGVKVYAARSGDELTDTDDEMRTAMRQIGGVFAQLEKTRLVRKLQVARDRKRATGARVEGRRPVTETHPEACAMARKLRRANPATGKRMSLRDIAEELFAAGHVNSKGKPFAAEVVKAMLATGAGKRSGIGFGSSGH